MKVLFFGDALWGARSLTRLHNDGVEIAGVVSRLSPSSGDLDEIASQLGLPVYAPNNCNDAGFLERDDSGTARRVPQSLRSAKSRNATSAKQWAT